jgi:hypothetical protein
MPRSNLLKLSILTAAVLLTSTFCYSQATITATFSQQGSVNYRITQKGNYIDISQAGYSTGFGCTENGSVTYDLKGRVDKIGNTIISYDFKGRIDALGAVPISYDLKGRIDKVGDYSISYDFKNRIDKIGELIVTYDFKDRVDKIGESAITYDLKGRVDKIDGNSGIVILKTKITDEQ